MKIKFSQIQKIKASCETIKEVKLPIKTTYKLSKLLDAINKEFEFYQAEFTKIIQTYAEKDENGNPALTENGQGIKISPNQIGKANEELFQLDNLESEIPDLTFNIDEFENCQLSMEELSGLMDFITE